MVKLTILIAVFTLGAFATHGQVGTATPRNDAEKELRAFYASYADDLLKQRREAIAERYDRRGTWFLGNGAKALESFEENKRYYLTKWKGPKAFAWKDIVIELPTETTAVVIARFDWQGETDDKAATCSYTGYLTKMSGQWRIRIEDESCPPKK